MRSSVYLPSTCPVQRKLDPRDTVMIPFAIQLYSYIQQTLRLVRVNLQ